MKSSNAWMSRRAGLPVLAILLAAIFATSSSSSQAQGGNSSATGTYGPVGEWIPFPPTPTVDSNSMLSATPTEGFGQPTKTPTPTTTPSPTPITYITVTPEYNVTLTPLPDETSFVTSDRPTHTLSLIHI